MNPDDIKVAQPVAKTAAVQALVMAIWNLFALPDVFDIKPTVTGAVNGIIIAASFAYNVIWLRDQVTPNSNVALTKPEEQRLLDAGAVPPVLPPAGGDG